jgi:hypothetical protein
MTCDVQAEVLRLGKQVFRRSGAENGGPLTGSQPVGDELELTGQLRRVGIAGQEVEPFLPDPANSVVEGADPHQDVHYIPAF